MNNENKDAPPAEAQPVAWEWEYVGSDPLLRGKTVARALHEMDPQNPPYPETWRPTRPLVYGDASPQQPAAVDEDDFDCPHSAFDNCDCYADQQGGPDNDR